MLDHVIVTVSDFTRSIAFYAQALKPLGITDFLDYKGQDGHPDERVRLEDGLKLDLNKLIRQKVVRPGSKTSTGIRWSYRYLDEEITTGKITADMTYYRRGWLRLELGNLDQWIDLETVPRHFGGRAR